MGFKEDTEAYNDWLAERRYSNTPGDYDDWVHQQEELVLLADLRELVANPEVTLEDVRNCLTAQNTP